MSKTIEQQMLEISSDIKLTSAPKRKTRHRGAKVDRVPDTGAPVKTERKYPPSYSFRYKKTGLGVTPSEEHNNVPQFTITEKSRIRLVDTGDDSCMIQFGLKLRKDRAAYRLANFVTNKKDLEDNVIKLAEELGLVVYRPNAVSGWSPDVINPRGSKVAMLRDTPSSSMDFVFPEENGLIKEVSIVRLELQIEVYRGSSVAHTSTTSVSVSDLPGSRLVAGGTDNLLITKHCSEVVKRIITNGKLVIMPLLGTTLTNSLSCALPDMPRVTVDTDAKNAVTKPSKWVLTSDVDDLIHATIKLSGVKLAYLVEVK